MHVNMYIIVYVIIHIVYMIIHIQYYYTHNIVNSNQAVAGQSQPMAQLQLPVFSAGRLAIAPSGGTCVDGLYGRLTHYGHGKPMVIRAPGCKCVCSKRLLQRHISWVLTGQVSSYTKHLVELFHL